MIDRALLARLRIEPLDREKHDRAAFSCGEERVDNYLKKTAARQQGDGHTRVSVACLDDSQVIIGYYALNAHAIDVTTLPDNDRKRLPHYPTISAVYLSIAGVQAEYQNKGIGSYIMADAFKRSAQAADVIGAHFLVLDALNDNAARLYRRLGFVVLVGHEPRMLMKMDLVRKAIAAAAAGA
jgi:ribosomal protein S18 acetylase RimI-like enzyme